LPRVGGHTITRDMALAIAPITHGDNAEKCTACGHAFGSDEPVFVAADLWPDEHLGHAVCDTCKPTKDVWGEKADWRRSFVCENCGRTVRYLYGREYRCCTYRCAAAVWSKKAIERRSSWRAEHHIKRLSCEVCGSTFLATRSDARICSAACRQRAHRLALTT
jgi:hypothetical protein